MSNQLNQMEKALINAMTSGRGGIVVESDDINGREELFIRAMEQHTQEPSIEEAKKRYPNAVNIGAIGHVDNGKTYLSECIAKELSKGQL